jgi:prepilin-type N-terminal cleavage/methylation domain-containing protein
MMGHDSENGFTLLEVMAAMLIFGLILGGMAPVFSRLVKRNTQMEIRGGAIAAAERVLDSIRLEDPSTLPASGSDAVRTITIDNRDFAVTATYCADATFCSSSNSRHISVDVTHNGDRTFEVQTVFTQLR